MTGGADDDPAESPPTAGAARLASARLYCERCGRETPHRIFHVRGGGAALAGAVEGVARCRECRWTHPFSSPTEARTEVALIVSDGAISRRRAVVLPPETPIRVGDPMPAVDERALVRKIDGRSGRPIREGSASDVATVWATIDSGAAVRVSIVEGARTRPARLVVPPETRLAVGAEVTVDGERLTIVALRARGHTWRRDEDVFPAGEVQRLYGRRTDSPPAGRSAWRTGRGIPRSRTSSTSRDERSRSSPGVRRQRTSP